jgi:phage host-nuclease inhibitor protein Gam
MSTRIKQQAAAFVPQTRDQVVEAIAEIGRRQRERDRIQAAMNDEIATIKQRYEEQARPHAEEITKLSAGVHTWCEAHRADLTQNGKTKTASLPSGEVRWRKRPPSVSIRNAKKALDDLKTLELFRYIRLTESVDKEAILADPEGVEGVRSIKITQSEDFVIVPFETALEEVA